MQFMQSNDYGKLNPNAPVELLQFDFLIGKWRCDAKIKNPNGTWTSLQATWVGRYILDGYVIADEYRMFDSIGNVVLLGMNFRAYNIETNSWNMKWFEALTSTWLDLGPQKLGGVQIDSTSISFKSQFKPEELHRIRFSNINEEHFTWSVDISTDKGQTWNESVMIIQANRVQSR